MKAGIVPHLFLDIYGFGCTHPGEVPEGAAAGAVGGAPAGPAGTAAEGGDGAVPDGISEEGGWSRPVSGVGHRRKPRASQIGIGRGRGGGRGYVEGGHVVNWC